MKNGKLKKSTNPMYKILGVISLIFGVLSSLLGLLILTEGGLFIIILGIVLILVGIYCFKIPKFKKETSNNVKVLDYVYVNKNGKAYHWDASCRSIGLNYDMITRDEARARGLKPCKHCDTF